MFAVALVFTLSVAAQTVQLSAECPAQFGFPTSYQVVGTPLAGQAVVLSQTSQLVFGASGFLLHVKVIGFSDPALPLPSCGCAVRASLDFVVAQISMPTSTTWVHNTSLNLPLPPGSTGLVFYTQSFALHPWTFGVGCVELGVATEASQSYQVTIQ
ncbi:MAG: hypothetical protein ABIP94_08370 [Planctomycetota bacterium]